MLLYSIATSFLATDIYKSLSHIEIELFARSVIHLHQGQLYLLMARSLHNRLTTIIVGIALEEDLVDVLCTLLCHIQPLALAGSLIVSNSSLVHMSHIIEFVRTSHIRIWRFARSSVVRLITQMRRKYMVLVEISIRLLCCRNDIYYFVHLGLESRILLEHKYICHTLHYLEEVGCRVVSTLKFTSNLLASKVCAHATEVLYRVLHLVERKWHQGLLLNLQTRQPEVVVNLDLVEWHLLEALLLGNLLSRQDHWQTQRHKYYIKYLLHNIYR